MSNIIYNNIDTTYPRAGQDNDSQGFRDNFSNIVGALQTAQEEIDRLQNRAVLKSNLSEVDDTTPVDNMLNGSTILNGSYNQFYSVEYTSTISEGSAITVNVRNGDSQTFIINEDINTGSVSILFQNWPTNVFAKVRLHIKMTQTDINHRDLSPIGTVAGSVLKPTGFPNPVSIHNLKYQVLEAWSNDGGERVYLNYLGEFG